MLAVRMPESEILPLLSRDLAIAAINSPSLCVIAGPFDAVLEFEKKLQALGIASKHLPTSHAFHSQMMEPVLAPFSELLRKMKFHEPQIPIVSNVTARWITPKEAASVEYWAGHVRQTVRFADGVAELFKDPNRVLLEVGPGQTLATLSRQHPAKSPEQVVLATLPYTGEQELRGVTETLGRLWLAGASVDWNAFYAKQCRRRVPLPTYPFDRKRYWPALADASATGQVALVPASSTPSAERKVASISVEPVVVSTIPAASAAPRSTQPSRPRKDRLVAETRALLEELSGYDLSSVDPSLNLLELGLDSLLLTQAAQLFQRRFSVTLSFRQLIEDISSIEAIAAHLDATMPPDAAPAPEPIVSVPAFTPVLPAGPSTGIADSSDIGRLIQQQQQLTNHIVQLLSRQQIPSGQSAPTAKRLPVPPILDNRTGGPFKPTQRGADVALTPRQARSLDSLIARYTKRTAGSKRLAAQNRTVLADPRSVSGFKQLWKEMVYPITTVKSDGSKVWDVDGNEYIDFVMGFGANLFGHRPPFEKRRCTSSWTLVLR
jgi:acyl transferase domain-containing protein